MVQKMYIVPKRVGEVQKTVTLRDFTWSILGGGGNNWPAQGRQHWNLSEKITPAEYSGLFLGKNNSTKTGNVRLCFQCDVWHCPMVTGCEWASLGLWQYVGVCVTGGINNPGDFFPVSLSVYDNCSRTIVWWGGGILSTFPPPPRIFALFTGSNDGNFPAMKQRQYRKSCRAPRHAWPRNLRSFLLSSAFLYSLSSAMVMPLTTTTTTTTAILRPGPGRCYSRHTVFLHVLYVWVCEREGGGAETMINLLYGSWKSIMELGLIGRLDIHTPLSRIYRGAACPPAGRQKGLLISNLL